PAAARVEQDAISLAGITHGEPIGGNEVVLVENERYLEACLELITGAERTIHVETFLWRSGRMSEALARALGERAQRGVAVRLLLDGLGSREADPEELEALRRAGARVEWLRPVGARHLGWLNNRTH